MIGKKWKLASILFFIVINYCMHHFETNTSFFYNEKHASKQGSVMAASELAKGAKSTRSFSRFRGCFFRTQGAFQNIYA